MKRASRDEALCDRMVEFWTRVLDEMPGCWATAHQVPDGGATGLDPLEGSVGKRRAVESPALDGAPAAGTVKRPKTTDSAEEFSDKLKK